MLKYIIAAILFIHGLIHFMGIAKAYGCNVPQLRGDISRPAGMLWLVSALLFIIGSVLLLSKKDAWYMFTIAGTILSQVLIVMAWQDAKWGTVANLLLLVAVIAQLSSHAITNS